MKIQSKHVSVNRLLQEARQAIIRSCLKYPYEPYQTAGGEWANNKLDINCLKNHSDDLQIVVRTLGYMAMQYEPDAFAGVPSGGSWLAEEVVEEVAKHKSQDYPIIEVKKQPLGAFTFSSTADREIAEKARRIIVIEDVGTTLGRVACMLTTLPAIRDSTITVLGAWLRGSASKRETLPQSQVLSSDNSEHHRGPILNDWITREFIPPNLSDQSPIVLEAKRLRSLDEIAKKI